MRMRLAGWCSLLAVPLCMALAPCVCAQNATDAATQAAEAAAEIAAPASPTAEAPTVGTWHVRVVDGIESAVLENTEIPLRATKFLRDGQLMIRLGDAVYNAFGARVE